MSDKKGLSYEQRKAMYEQTESDTLTNCVTIHITATQIITEVKRMIPQKDTEQKEYSLLRL